MDSFVNKNFLAIVLFLILLSTLLLVLPGIFKNTDIRKKAAGTTADFQIYPVNEVFHSGETKTFQVKSTFSNPSSSSETVDYLKMTISFPSDYFKVPDDDYIKVNFSGQKNLERIIRQDGPVAANQNGKIILEVAAATPGSGPSTSVPATLASFNLTALKDTQGPLPISVEVNQMVNSLSVNMDTTMTAADVQVGDNISPNPTNTVVPTVANCNHSSGDANCDGTIDVADFDIWVREFSGQITTTRADFNQSGKIDLVDLEIWRRNTAAY